MTKLTDKQERFCNEYIIDLNASQAAVRAGYKKKSAAVIGAQNLLKAYMQERIAVLQEPILKEQNITKERVSLEMARLAFNDPRKAFDSNGLMLPVKEWPDEVAAAISSIKVTETEINEDVTVQVKEIKFWDKGKQLDLAARHLGMLNDKLTIVNKVVKLNRKRFDGTKSKSE